MQPQGIRGIVGGYRDIISQWGPVRRTAKIPTRTVNTTTLIAAAAAAADDIRTGTPIGNLTRLIVCVSMPRDIVGLCHDGMVPLCGTTIDANRRAADRVGWLLLLNVVVVVTGGEG